MLKSYTMKPTRKNYELAEPILCNWRPNLNFNITRILDLLLLKKKKPLYRGKVSAMEYANLNSNGFYDIIRDELAKAFHVNWRSRRLTVTQDVWDLVTNNGQ